MQKQLEGTQKHINEQAEERCSYRGATPCNYCEQYTIRFQWSINAC